MDPCLDPRADMKLERSSPGAANSQRCFEVPLIDILEYVYLCVSFSGVIESLVSRLSRPNKAAIYSDLFSLPQANKTKPLTISSRGLMKLSIKNRGHGHLRDMICLCVHVCACALGGGRGRVRTSMRACVRARVGACACVCVCQYHGSPPKL